MNKIWAMGVALLGGFVYSNAIEWEPVCEKFSTNKLIRASEHFEICKSNSNYAEYGGGSNTVQVDYSLAQQSLNILEDIFAFYHGTLEWMLPQPNNPQKKLKNVVYVYNDNKMPYPIGGKNYPEGCVTPNDCSAFILIGKSWLNNRWILAHEYTHGLQSFTGNIGDDRHASWISETHANWVAHQYIPNEVPDGGEDLIDFPYLYYGSTRLNYVSWHFLEHLKEKFGGGIEGAKQVNRIWTDGLHQDDYGWSEQTPFTAMMRVFNWSLETLNDEFGRFAMKQATLEYEPSHKAIYREKWGDYDFATRRDSREYSERPYGAHTRVTMLDRIDSVNNRYVSPSYWAPQRFGYNLVRIYPKQAGKVKVKFRGLVQDYPSINGYVCPDPMYVNDPKHWCHNAPRQLSNPASGWRAALVAESMNGTPRYSEMKRGSNFELEIETRRFDKALWLVVVATPTEMQTVLDNQYYYSIYRYPYMIEVNNGNPEGYNNGFWEPANTSRYHRHSNGGGWVSNSANVSTTAYVGPNAVVNGGTVSGYARIEDFAVIDNGVVTGNALVRDRAFVSGGTVRDNALLEDDAWLVEGTIRDYAKVGALSVIRNSDIEEYAQVYTVFLPIRDKVIGGYAQLRGDIETDFTQVLTEGIFYGKVDTSVLNNRNYNPNYTIPPVDATQIVYNPQWDSVIYPVISRNTDENTTPVLPYPFKPVETNDVFGVYDLNGKYLGNVKASMPDVGLLKANLRASGFNSGMYFVRGQNSRKMLRVDVR